MKNAILSTISSPSLRTILLRCLLVLFTAVLLMVMGLWMTLNQIFNGPSESARDALTISLLESDSTKWIPALFIGSDKVAEIQAENAVVLPDAPDGSNAPIRNSPFGLQEARNDHV